jgi:hypothetical protein
MEVMDRYAFLTVSVREELEQQGWPKTVEAAADFLIKHTSTEEKLYLKSIPKRDLIQFHHSMGQWIRNEFGLWRGNKQLLADAGTEHPDDASGVIIDRIWEKLHASSAT